MPSFAYGNQTQPWVLSLSSSCIRQGILWVTVFQASGQSTFSACNLAVGMVKLLASFTKCSFYWVLGI